jgi:hypothetical protein
MPLVGMAQIIGWEFAILSDQNGNFFPIFRLVYTSHSSSILPLIAASRQKESGMVTLVKLAFAIIGTAIAWLVGGYTLEYFRPYHKKK